MKRIVYLGSGGLQGAARESALKVLELTAGKLAAFMILNRIPSWTKIAGR